MPTLTVARAFGGFKSFLNESFPPKSNFNPASDIPDLSGRIILLTGGNAGIGKETVKHLLRCNAKVYLAARDEAKASAAIADLKQQTGKEAIFLKIDLSDLQSVKHASEEFLSKEDRLDILINNAGLTWPPLDMLSTQGYDIQFGVHVIGHYYLTKLLLPTMLATAKVNQDKKVRVINLSSLGHVFFSDNEIKYETLRDGPARRKLGTEQLYFQSKFAVVILSLELAHRYGNEGIVSISLNPGTIRSDLVRYMDPTRRFLLRHLLSFPVEKGAITTLWAATTDEALEMNGKYLIPWARVGSASKFTQSATEGAKLWNWLEDQVKDI